MLSDGSVSVVGLGNIGGVLCDLLARMPEVTKINLIDYGAYSEGDLSKQAITRSEIGKPKAYAVARRLKRIRPGLAVNPYFARVEDLPYGSIRAVAVCACTDTRISRIHINERAWRMGLPFIDAGVLASQMLARVEMFVPGPEAPCLECAFGADHYETMEVAHPCRGGMEAPSTNAPVYLGAAAASMQAAECHLLIQGKLTGLKGGEQAIFDLHSHQYLLSRNRFNPRCRFDHAIYSPQLVWANESLADIFVRCSSTSPQVAMSVAGRLFLRAERCNRCGRRGPSLKLAPLNSIPGWRCRGCGEWQPAHPGMLVDRICQAEVPVSLQRKSPCAIGLRAGDLLNISDGLDDHWYLLGDSGYREESRRSESRKNGRK